MANWGKGNGELAWWEQAVGGSIAGAVFALVPQECALVLQECVRFSFLVLRDEEVGEGGKGELEGKGVKKFWGRGSRDETGQGQLSTLPLFIRLLLSSPCP